MCIQPKLGLINEIRKSLICVINEASLYFLKEQYLTLIKHINLSTILSTLTIRVTFSAKKYVEEVSTLRRELSTYLYIEQSYLNLNFW